MNTKSSKRGYGNEKQTARNPNVGHKKISQNPSDKSADFSNENQTKLENRILFTIPFDRNLLIGVFCICSGCILFIFALIFLVIRSGC